MHQPGPESAPLIIFGIGCLILGIVAGFSWSMDRQLRGGIIAQRTEAIERDDWVPITSLQSYLPRAFLTVVDPDFESGRMSRSTTETTTVPRELVREIHQLQAGLGGQAHERIMAPVLEQRLNNRQILELYLNRVALGEADGYPIYGVYHAAEEYFGKTANELTVGEAATLAGLLLPPRIENPREKAGAVGVRRNEVLRALYRGEAITAQQYQSAIQERLAFQPGLSEFPMSRRMPTFNDTAVVRLPPQYRPQALPQDSTAQ